MSTRDQFDAALAQIRADLLLMGFETETMLRDAVAALVGDPASAHNAHGFDAETIIARDNIVDDLEERLEAACLEVLASGQQPVAPADLRFLTTVLKVATDVERIGDHAVNIAKTVSRMQASGIWYRPLVDIGRLGDMTAHMLHDALEALVHQDTARAENVIRADDAVDALYARMRASLQSTMEADPAVTRLCASLLFVIHYLERVSDHATNIAERLLYLATGQHVPKNRSAPGK